MSRYAMRLDRDKELFHVQAWQLVNFRVYAKDAQGAVRSARDEQFSTIQRLPEFDDITVRNAKNEVVYKSSNIIRQLKDKLAASCAAGSPHTDAYQEVLNTLSQLEQEEQEHNKDDR